MEIAKTQCFALAMLIIIGTSILGVSSAQQCHVNFSAVVAKCIKLIQIPGPKVPPSAECCQVLQGFNIPCFCNLVTPIIEQQVSIEKLVYVARNCGLTVEPGTHCGSYTVPPSASVSE